MTKIDRMFAFIAEDAGPDDEGVMAFRLPDGWMPLVGADMARVASLRPLARIIAIDTGKPARLVEFSVRREVEVIRPDGN